MIATIVSALFPVVASSVIAPVPSLLTMLILLFPFLSVGEMGMPSTETVKYGSGGATTHILGWITMPGWVYRVF